MTTGPLAGGPAQTAQAPLASPKFLTPKGFQPWYRAAGGAIGQGSVAHAASIPEQAPQQTEPTTAEKHEEALEEGKQSWTDIAATAGELAAGFVPGVGEALDAYNAYQSFQQGDYLSAGLNAAAAAVGAVPIAGDVAALGLRGAAKAVGKGATTDILSNFNPFSGGIAQKAATVKDYAFTGLAAPELVSDISAKLGEETPFNEQAYLDSGPTFSDDDGGFGVGGGTSFSEQVKQEAAVSLDEFGGTGGSVGGFSQQQDDSDNNDHYAGGSWNSAEQVQAEADVGLDAFGGSGDDDSGGGGGGK